MPKLESPSAADRVGTLPAKGLARNRQLNRLVDSQAAAEAAAALRAAAERKKKDNGVLATALNAASRLLTAEVSDGAFAADDRVRDQLHEAVASPELRSLIPGWVDELREVASKRTDTGACTVGTALQLWAWTADHLARCAPDALDELVQAFVPLLAARYATIDAKRDRDLGHVYAAHAAARAAATCAELVFGNRRHLAWNKTGCSSCYAGDEVDSLEGFIPGIASGARSNSDVVEADGSHEAKEGPCARFEGLDRFIQLRNKLDGCLTGARIAKARAAAAIASSIATATPSKKSKGRA